MSTERLISRSLKTEFLVHNLESAVAVVAAGDWKLLISYRGTLVTK